MAAKKKLTLYFPEELLQEVQEEARRQERSLSWIVQKAWVQARSAIQGYPSIQHLNVHDPDQ